MYHSNVLTLFGFHAGQSPTARGSLGLSGTYRNGTYKRISTRAIYVSLLAFLLLAVNQPKTFAEPLTKPEDNKTVSQPTLDIKPNFITLSLPNNLSMDTEIIQWPDGSFSVPVKTLAVLLNIDVQLADDEKRLFWVDPVTKQKIDLYWEQNRLLVNDEPIPTGAHPPMRSDGLLIPDDIYMDQATFSRLFQVSFKLDNETTTISLNTERKLKLSASDDGANNILHSEINLRLIQNPEVSRKLIDKVYFQHTSNYGYQVSQQVASTPNQLSSTYFTSLVDTTSVGIRGSILGLDYYVKPSIIRFNKKANFERIDWSLQREFKNNLISLGSTDAGLSTLTTPSLNIWGLKIASKNALTPTLISKSAYDFTGPSTSGNQVTVRINNRTVQSVTAKDNSYEFEPVYLQPQSINHVQIIEKDSQNQEKILLDKTIANFPNLLPKGESGYSAFLGRVPLQFYPLIPDQKTPIRIPQSEKWLTGGRLFYGVSNRVTLGLSGSADHIFGTPKTYYTSLNPYSVDLTGFSSYQRDSNFFSGQNASLSLRYQLTDRWFASADAGIGHMNMKPGSLLSIPDSATGKAGEVHLERQGSLLNWYVDAFHYDPYYYMPSVALYGNTLYDKRGIGTGVSGSIGRWLPISYSANWSHYQTNLERLIPGGRINADRWGGTLNSQLSRNNNVSLTFNWVKGTNHDREFLQRFADLSYRTQSLPWGLQGEIKANYYYTNTLFLPSKTQGTDLIETPYKNHGVETALDIPLDKTRQNHIRISNRISSFVDYGYIQGFFQFHNLFVEPLIQVSYGNRPQHQNRFGVKVGYQFPSGARFSISYYKLASSFQAPAGTSVQSKINTNQLYFDFSDVLGLLGHHLKSLGPNADAAGMLTGTLFADYHPNGKRDKAEPGIKDVKLIIDKQHVITTDTNGQYQVGGLSAGYHTLEIIPDELPLTISAENPIYNIKISEGKTHRVDIALMPEGGILRGRLDLVDADEKPINPKNIILVLTNEQGESLKYTSVDEQGKFKFSNIPAGHYHIDLESKIKHSGRYKVMNQPTEVTLAIPKHYAEVQEVGDLNFKLLAL